uniref:Uncharacterized protein n=1 Tax=Ditylenchus dipsaci TaxID=166011 RepID=A0A915DQ63_9BILA
MLQKLIPEFGIWEVGQYLLTCIIRLTKNWEILLVTIDLFVFIYECLHVGVIRYLLPPRTPSDPRTINLMKWFLQLCSFAGIYWSLRKPIAICCYKDQKIVREFIHGPDPRKLLTEQEYIEEADVYTKAELDQLRRFCTNSPSKSNWKLVQNLHDPHRMASFITGDSDHVTQVESGSIPRFVGRPRKSKMAISPMTMMTR